VKRGFAVAHKRCDECLFSDAKIVSDKRREQILDECESHDSHFICHKATMNEREAMCRGHYDAAMDGSMVPPQMLRIAGRLDCIYFCDPETGEEVTP